MERGHNSRNRSVAIMHVIRTQRRPVGEVDDLLLSHARTKLKELIDALH